MQLVAYGAQDIYLTGNPQITFFKCVYRRHTNFALESIENVFSGNADFGKKVTCTISRNGDLIWRTYLRVHLPTVTLAPGGAFRWLNYVGQAMIANVEIEIGGQRIDRHYGDFLHIRGELTLKAGHQIGYGNAVGNIPQLTNPHYNTTSSPIQIKGEILYTPLQFWFTRDNPGQALPLIGLQYHECKINVEFRQATDCYWAASQVGGVYVPNTSVATVPSMLSCSLFIDYVYLDTDERRRFAQVSHEYLIEQLQFTGDESANTTNLKLKLNFNHPTKELIWVVQPDDNVSSSAPMGKQWFNYTDDYDHSYSADFAFGTTNDIAVAGTTAAGLPGIAAGGANGVYVPTSFEGGDSPVSSVLLQLNGHDRLSQRDGRYFNIVQPLQHHENVPSKGINVYSFAIKPEEHQPSGTCNFSRIDNATLNLWLTKATVTASVPGAIVGGVQTYTTTQRTCKIRIYAINYNVLRIMSGMGGLAYSD